MPLIAQEISEIGFQHFAHPPYRICPLHFDKLPNQRGVEDLGETLHFFAKLGDFGVLVIWHFDAGGAQAVLVSYHG